MYDICIASIPYIPYHLPPAAPAVLKGHLQSQGFTAITKEYNIEFREVLNDNSCLSRIISYWIDDTIQLSEQDKIRYEEILDLFARDMTIEPVRWLGLSVFTPHSRRFCSDFLPYLNKHKSPETKIVLGGMGMDLIFIDEVKNLIDVHINGEGEWALVNLLKGNMDYPGINSPGEQILDLDQIGSPNYADYKRLADYDNFYDGPAIQLTGSRGCVRDCTFCNVGSLWPKYRYRSGGKVAKDIIELYKSTGIRHYFFTDSLINGNVKELMAMMRVLADFNNTTSANITWGGQWIARKQKGLPKDYYRLIKESGGYNITIGVETGSDSVRSHMRKGFTTEDLNHEMEQFSKHGIGCSFYIMVAYPTETEADFIQTLDMLNSYTKYVADGTLLGITIAAGFGIHDGAPVSKEKGKIFIVENNNVREWRSLVTDLDYIESMRRRIIIQRVVNNLKYPTNNVVHDLTRLLIGIKNMLIEKYGSIQPDKDEKFDNISQNYVVNTQPEDTEIELELTGNFCKDWPIIDIAVNSEFILKDKELIASEKIKFKVPFNKKRNILSIKLTNKNLATDTELDHDGNIVADKSVIINDVKINGVRFKHTEIYIKGRILKDSGEKIKGHGLYANGALKLYFENPFLRFALSQRHSYWEKFNEKNKELVQRLVTFFQQLKNNG